MPPAVRRYVADGGYTKVAKGIMNKYALHIDQATILEREIMLLLIGVETPSDFASALVSEAAIPVDTLHNIVSDINQQIFAPLQKQMQLEAQGTDIRPGNLPAANTRPSVPAQQKPAAPVSAAIIQKPPLPASSQTKAMPGPVVVPSAVTPPIPSKPSGLGDVIRQVTLHPAGQPQPRIPAPVASAKPTTNVTAPPARPAAPAVPPPKPMMPPAPPLPKPPVGAGEGEHPHVAPLPPRTMMPGADAATLRGVRRPLNLLAPEPAGGATPRPAMTTDASRPPLMHEPVVPAPTPAPKPVEVVKPLVPTKAAPETPVAAPAQAPKSYAADPYREPIE